jgi:peptide/nickel transport system substrate-binding protein
VPVLATGWKLNSTATAVAITLRSGVKFHGGNPLTASDVKYSFDRYVAIGQGIASELADYKSATVTDATHLTISLKAPDALFVDHLSKLYILDQKALAPHLGGDSGQTWLQNHDVGSGPYELSDGKMPILLTRFTGYWDFASWRPATYRFFDLADSATAEEELKNGQLDIGTSLQDAQASAAAGAGVGVDWLSVPNTAYIFMNTAAGPTANPVVRKALRLAFNYTGGIKTFFQNQGTIENGPVPQGVPCLVNTPAFSQNLAEAKSMLAAAGLSHLTLTLRDQPSLPDQVGEATMFQSDLKSIGVTLNLEPITFPQYLASLTNPKTIPEMALIQDSAPEPDAGLYLEKAFDSANIGSTNRAGYKNPQVDALLSRIQTDTDPASSCATAKQVQTIVNDDAPSVSMYTLKAPVAYRSGITGIEPSAIIYPMSLRTIRFG